MGFVKVILFYLQSGVTTFINYGQAQDIVVLKFIEKVTYSLPYHIEKEMLYCYDHYRKDE